MVVLKAFGVPLLFCFVGGAMQLEMFSTGQISRPARRSGSVSFLNVNGVRHAKFAQQSSYTTLHNCLALLYYSISQNPTVAWFSKVTKAQELTQLLSHTLKFQPVT